jgi:hypothetical protein
MLQTVHKEIVTSKASSLHCVRVCQELESRREAIWIDRQLSVFEKQIGHEAEIDFQSKTLWNKRLKS